MKKFFLILALIATVASYAVAEAPFVRLFADTAANLSASNPAMQPGDIGYETDTYKMKVCPGPLSELYNTLAYTSVTSSFPTITATRGVITNMQTSGTITAATLVATGATTTTCTDGINSITIVGGVVTAATCSY